MSLLIPTYSLAAVGQVPPLLAPSAQPLIYAPDGLPTTGPSLVGGETTALLTRFNTVSARTDAIGRAGAGSYGIAAGLDLQSDGTSLTLTVSAGTAMLDGPVTLKAAQTLPMTTGQYNWVWLTQAGTLVVTTLGAPSPVPAGPTGVAVFLGRVDATSGSIGAVDYSGRPQLRSGVLWRETGDLAGPGDTPPATLAFFHRTLGGLYVWDGVAYSLVSNSSAAVVNLAVAGLLQQLQAQTDLRTLLEQKFRALLFAWGTLGFDVPTLLQDDFSLAASEQP